MVLNEIQGLAAGKIIPLPIKLIIPQGNITKLRMIIISLFKEKNRKVMLLNDSHLDTHTI